jgi:gag-polyprotein putative aspartyl protease
MTLDVNIQGHKTKAVIDSGCTGNMISPKFADKVGVQRLKRAQKVYLYTFDGSPVKENNGMIEEETGKISLKIGRYEERVKFDIVTTQGYDITLGFPWLSEHNFIIDYSDRSMRFDNCMHDGKRNAKVKLKEISLKAMFMQYHRDPDSVVLAMVNLEEIK